SGDIHLNGLAFVDRLHSGEHALAWLAVNGIRLPGGVIFANPPNHPETLLAQMVKYSDILDALFSDSIGWYAFNYMAAPFVCALTDKELRQFAEMLLYECAYRRASLADGRPPMRVSLFWNAPQEMAETEAIGPGGVKDGKTYKQHELTARRLAWALLDVFQGGGVNDADFPAPVMDVVLDETVFQTFEGADYLRHAAAAALRRPHVRFVLACPEGDKLPVMRPFWFPRKVVWHRIALNLPRAAISGEGVEGFFVTLDQLCRLAVAAHVQKRDFMELLLDPLGNAPLAALALECDGKPCVSSADGIFTVDVDGLFECAQVIHGTGMAARDERLRFMKSVLTHLTGTLGTLADAEGIRCILAANTNAAISRRFATLDAHIFPRLVEKIVKTDPQSQAMTYTTGVALSADAGMSPVDIARSEGALHQALGEQQFSRLSWPLKDSSEKALSDMLKMLLRQTACGGIAL
ncbi:MAG TPA: hypothetical protein ENN65_04205, partial [Candidatus Hydrogenedentes bacterium]|nr:hypothetical protein [Candidatus Hydrogenedentota bacterium]